MTRHPVLPLLLAALLAVAGCGKSPTAAPTKSGLGSGAPTSAPAAPTGPAPAMPAPGVPGMGPQAAIANLQQAWMAVRTLSGHYDHWEKNGGDVETDKVDFWFQKPSHYRLEVSDATDMLKRGSKSVFDLRTRKISSRPGGPLSFAKLDGTLDDARTKSVHGYTLDQTDYQSLVLLVLNNAATVRVVPGKMPGTTLELPTPPKFAGIEALRVTLDPQKNLPIYFEMAQHGQVVYTRKQTALNVNPAIAGDKFSL